MTHAHGCGFFCRVNAFFLPFAPKISGDIVALPPVDRIPRADSFNDRRNFSVRSRTYESIIMAETGVNSTFSERKSPGKIGEQKICGLAENG